MIKYQSDTKFMNLGFFDYGSHTILTVSIDKDNNKPHNSLQYDVNAIIKMGKDTLSRIMAKLLLERKEAAK